MEDDEAAWVRIEVTDVTGPDDFVVVTIAEEAAGAGWVARQPRAHPYLRAVEQLHVDELVRAVRASCAPTTQQADGVLHQFRLDFPRCHTRFCGERQTCADAFWARVHQSAPPHVARSVLVLCTQGALADVYCAVLRYLVREPDTHVVDAGHYEIEVDLAGDQVRMRISKRFQLVHIDEDPEALAEVRVQLQLELGATRCSGNQIIEAFESRA